MLITEQGYPTTLMVGDILRFKLVKITNGVELSICRDGKPLYFKNPTNLSPNFSILGSLDPIDPKKSGKSNCASIAMVLVAVATKNNCEVRDLDVDEDTINFEVVTRK